MTRRRWLVLVLVAAIISSIAAWLYAHRFRTSLTLNVSPDARTFAFTTTTDLAWDRMFVFGPYTSKEDAEGTIGSPWPGYFPYDDSEGVNVVAFVKDGHVVKWSEVSRRPVELGWLNRRGGYTRAEAVFDIDRHGDYLDLRTFMPGTTLPADQDE